MVISRILHWITFMTGLWDRHCWQLNLYQTAIFSPQRQIFVANVTFSCKVWNATRLACASLKKPISHKLFAWKLFFWSIPAFLKEKGFEFGDGSTFGVKNQYPVLSGLEKASIAQFRRDHFFFKPPVWGNIFNRQQNLVRFECLRRGFDGREDITRCPRFGQLVYNFNILKNFALGQDLFQAMPLVWEYPSNLINSGKGFSAGIFRSAGKNAVKTTGWRTLMWNFWIKYQNRFANRRDDFFRRIPRAFRSCKIGAFGDWGLIGS